MRYFVKFLLVFFWLSPAYAQVDSQAETVFLLYIDAAKQSDTSSMVSYIHPDALREFRGAYDDVLNGPFRAKAEAELLPLFGLSSREQFDALSDAEVFALFSRVALASAPELMRIMKTASVRVLDQVGTGDQISFVYAMTLEIQGQESTHPLEQDMKMFQGQWRLMLPAESKNAMAKVRAYFSQQ